MRPADLGPGASLRVLASWLLLAMCAELVLLLNWPGHLSVDSVIQLHEGVTGAYRSFNPPFASWLTARLYFPALGAGLITAAFVLAMFAAFGPPLARIARRRALPWAAGLALLIAWTLAPMGLIYPAIIWKDILLALLVLGMFNCLARGQEVPSPATQDQDVSKVLGYAGAAVLGAAAVLSRQHGLLFVLTAAMALAVPGTKLHSSSTAKEARRTALGDNQQPQQEKKPASKPIPAVIRVLSRHPMRLAWAWLGSIILLSWVASACVRAMASEGPPEGGRIGLMLLMVYDIGGIVARLPINDLPSFRDIGVDVPKLLSDVRASFHPSRIDGYNPQQLWNQRPSFDIVFAQWTSLVTTYPTDYMAHRWEVFAWMLGLRDPAACLPLHLGIVTEPSSMLKDLQIAPIPPERYAGLYRYAASHFQGPLLRPVFWLGLVSLGAAVLAWRGWRRHRLALALALGTLAYCAAYLVVGIACDVRYMYVAAPASLWLWLTVLADLGRDRADADSLPQASRAKG